MAETQLDYGKLEEVTLDVGDTILVEGGVGDNVYILKTGEVKVTKAGKDIATINDPGTIFGEIASLIEVPNTATVSATKQSIFYIIEDLAEYVKHNPESGIVISTILAQRLYKMTAHFVEIKEELDAMQEAAEAPTGLAALVNKMDSFWGKTLGNEK